VTSSIWDECAVLLQQELSAQQYNTWIRPLTAEHEGHEFCLIAPNRFVMDWINQKFIHRIHELVNHVCTQANQAVPDVIAVKVAGRQQPAFQSGSSSRSYNSPSSNSAHSGSLSGSVSGSDNGFEQLPLPIVIVMGKSITSRQLIALRRQGFIAILNQVLSSRRISNMSIKPRKPSKISRVA